MNARQQEYYDQIRAVVESKGGIVISDQYEKMVNKMIFRCENGHEWDTEARSILKGMWCRYCHGNTLERGEENFRKRVVEKGGLVLGAYTGNANHILVQCVEGHQWEIKPHNVTAGKWCPVCAYRHHGGGSTRFLRTLDERGGKLLDRYVNTRTRVRVQCDKGHIWDPKPYYIVIGNWCPFCSGSSGEQAIASYLTEKHIAYISQSTIPGLPRKRFDFIIQYEGYDIIIEYDGKMHFNYNPYYHITEEYFEHRQLVDRVKMRSAFNAGYKMIRIDDYQVLHIREHLDNALSQLDAVYLASPKLYKEWRIEEGVTPEEVAEVNAGRSRPDYEYLEDNTVVSPTPKLTLQVIRPTAPKLQLSIIR